MSRDTSLSFSGKPSHLDLVLLNTFEKTFLWDGDGEIGGAINTQGHYKD